MDHEGRVVASAPWAELHSLVGREFVGSWLQVDDEHIDLFERGSYLKQNANQMSVGEYPDGLVEGFHLLALLDHLVNDVSFVDDPQWWGWNYGFDRVRFVSPVTTNDRVRVRGSVESVTPRGENMLVTYAVALEVDGRQKPGMVAQWLVLWSVDTAA